MGVGEKGVDRKVLVLGIEQGCEGKGERGTLV